MGQAKDFSSHFVRQDKEDEDEDEEEGDKVCEELIFTNSFSV